MLQGSVSTSVDATPEIVWQTLTDKIESLELSLPEPSEMNVLQRNADFIVRERFISQERFVERITVDNTARKVLYTLVNHPVYEGYVSHQLLRSDSGGTPGCILAFAIDWRMKIGEELSEIPDMLEMTNDDLFHIREIIEKRELEYRAEEAANPARLLEVAEKLGASEAQDNALDNLESALHSESELAAPTASTTKTDTVLDNADASNQ